MNGTLIRTDITEKEWNYIKASVTKVYMQVNDIKFILKRNKYTNTRGSTINRLARLLKKENKSS